MQILVINPGSSSLKFSLYASDGADEVRALAEGEVSGVGADAALEFRAADGRDLAGGLGEVRARSMGDATALVERALDAAGLPATGAVGYRVVHPGPRLRGHQRITPQVLDELRAAVRFAPLHDPAAVELIEEMMRRMPDVPHFACFDTVFHETMPEEATVYPLPEAVRAEGVRRYGFHGLSCESVVQEMREALGNKLPARMVIAHLGSGCSVTACVDGRSVDTTMGLTPTGGVVMGTRPGDLDPGVLLYLLRREGATVDSVESMLNHDAGLKALGGVNDMRELRRRAGAADEAARLAIAVFTRSVARAIAGMVALYRAETVVFTGGIGEHDAASRVEIAGLLEAFAVDPHANAAGLSDLRVQRISLPESQRAVYIARAEEDRMIARHVKAMCARSQ